MPRATSFTVEQDEYILGMRAAGMTYEWLADRLGYSPQGVRWRWLRLTRGDDGLREPQTARRTCLMCGNPFASSGPGNRICNGCKLSAAWERADNRIIKLAGQA